MASFVPQMENIAFNGANTYYFKNGDSSKSVKFDTSNLNAEYVLTFPNESGTISLGGGNVAADNVTVGDAASSFGTTTGLVRMYTLDDGVCIDAATGSKIDMKINGDVQVGVSEAQLVLRDNNPFTIAHGTNSNDDDLTISLTGATDSSIILSSSGTGNDSIQLVSSAGGIDIAATGSSAVRIQRYKEFYNFHIETTTTSEQNLWSNSYIDENSGLSGSYLIKAQVAAVHNGNGTASAYEITNCFFGDPSLGLSTIINGITYTGSKIGYGDTGTIGSASNLKLNSDGSNTVRLQMTPTTANTHWSGVVEVIYTTTTP